jgi:hypothetical protein
MEYLWPKNANFLFHRDFMEYQEDDEDFSVLVYENENLLRYCLQTELKLLFFRTKV